MSRLSQTGSSLLLAGLLALAACGTEAETPQASAPLAPASDAQESGSLRGESLALACSGCHGGTDAAIPDLSAYDAETMETLLLTYKEEAEGGTVMHRLMRGYSEEDIAAVSVYLSTDTESD